MSNTLIQSYSETNVNSDWLDLVATFPSAGADLSAGGPAFGGPASVYTLTSFKLYMKKIGSPTGNGYGRLYACANTPNTDGKVTGAALASSAAFNIATLTTSYVLTEFTFAVPYKITANTNYCLVFENPGAGISGGNTPGS